MTTPTDYKRNYLLLLLLSVCYKLSKEAPISHMEISPSNRPTRSEQRSAVSPYSRPDFSRWNNVTNVLLESAPSVCGDIVAKAVCAYFCIEAAYRVKTYNFRHVNPT
ncbi:protein E21A [Elephant endotheliotropic herpesvirus 5B]|uniref:Protein EE27 n=1 Tax=Elephant endotheliotropic herpesvirus 5 TaxID=768738 RepID=A0A075CZS5_9BETA|nr:protein EE27 [Elephant endotheliotropic herpesvirus 5]AHC02824.1 protein EE27 [Elephant endotheliotropic herpesvirus 5]UVZ35209.1 protein E21A [Elephant endotheliotropic herpesvirus 5B]